LTAGWLTNCPGEPAWSSY